MFFQEHHSQINMILCFPRLYFYLTFDSMRLFAVDMLLPVIRNSKTNIKKWKNYRDQRVFKFPVFLIFSNLHFKK